MPNRKSSHLIIVKLPSFQMLKLLGSESNYMHIKQVELTDNTFPHM